MSPPSCFHVLTRAEGWLRARWRPLALLLAVAAVGAIVLDRCVSAEPDALQGPPSTGRGNGGETGAPPDTDPCADTDPIYGGPC